MTSVQRAAHAVVACRVTKPAAMFADISISRLCAATSHRSHGDKNGCCHAPHFSTLPATTHRSCFVQAKHDFANFDRLDGRVQGKVNEIAPQAIQRSISLVVLTLYTHSSHDSKSEGSSISRATDTSTPRGSSPCRSVSSCRLGYRPRRGRYAAGVLQTAPHTVTTTADSGPLRAGTNRLRDPRSF